MRHDIVVRIHNQLLTYITTLRRIDTPQMAVTLTVLGILAYFSIAVVL